MKASTPEVILSKVLCQEKDVIDLWKDGHDDDCCDEDANTAFSSTLK